MRRLGYDRYGAQGGDTGAIVSPELGRLDPDHMVGIHVNNLLTFPSGDPSELADLSEADQDRLQWLQHWSNDMSGYAIVQSTRRTTACSWSHPGNGGRPPSTSCLWQVCSA